jgi:hypothetical protein
MVRNKMNVGELKEALKDVPDDYVVETDESLVVTQVEVDDDWEMITLDT